MAIGPLALCASRDDGRHKDKNGLQHRVNVHENALDRLEM